MKRILLLLVILMVIQLCAEHYTISNRELEISSQNGYQIISSGEMTIYSQEAGEPAIPLISTWIELPSDQEVRSVRVTPQKLREEKLAGKLYPVQKAVPYSIGRSEFIEPDAERYGRDFYPETWINSWKTEICGGHKLVNLSVFAAQYLPRDDRLLIPEGYEIEIETVSGALPEHVNTSAVESVMSALGLGGGIDREPDSYLVIVPMMFVNSLQPLLDWRRLQGYEVYVRTTSEIEAGYAGEDQAAKIRACISDMQQSYGIGYVTLAGDHQHIPTRFAYAFDCAYGAHEDENELACDMYYSCLDGDWNADADSLYGEDEDAVDLLPEVFVGRIPANSAAEMTGYISRLIQYERGDITDYNRAGGLSMELWEGAQSELCQQYIYDNYFPDGYEIDFLYGDENSEENAFALISEGQNIMQHTGHAWINVLVLENYGHIYNYNVAELSNDWGGLFYSIGCWSNSFDNDSIGEAFVRESGRNFLGYVGNSSYGWGAPSAAGFGFSEFYQREFFRLLFAGEEKVTDLGKVQAEQKLAFLPYFGGTSVYKWVGYELNLCGDALAALFTDNPDSLMITASHYADQLLINVADMGGEAIDGAVVSMGGDTWTTGVDGMVILPWEGGSEEVYGVYARGYRYQEIDNTDIIEQPVLVISLEPDEVEQGLSYRLLLTVMNPLDTEISFQVAAGSEPEVVEFSYDFDQIYTISANDSDQLSDMYFTLSDQQQYENGSPVKVDIELQYTDMTFPTVSSFSFTILSGEIRLTELNWSQEEFIAGAEIPVELIFTSGSEIADISLLQFELVGDEAGYLSFEPEVITEEVSALSAGEQIAINTVLAIDTSLPEDYYTVAEVMINLEWGTGANWSRDCGFYLGNAEIQIAEDFESELEWTGDSAWQRVDEYACSGSFSLSCRPEEVGSYLLVTPEMIWLPGTEIGFWYRSKMPMYGEDGFYLRLVSGEEEELIIFLGSGGALSTDSNRPLPEVYLETGWVYYEFEPEELLMNLLENGDSYHLEFDFNYSEVIEGFCEYAEMPEIGIFIDDLIIRQSEFLDSEDSLISALEMTIFPNPYQFNNERQPLAISFLLNEPGRVEAAVYDIRGRKCQQIIDQSFSAGSHQYQWQPRREMSSGIYFVRLISSEKTILRKFLFLR